MNLILSLYMFKIIKKLNLQFIISYFGIIPFLLIFFDLNMFNFFDSNLLKGFAILYLLIIFSFIGAMRWSFKNNINFIEIMYGFFPSLFSSLLIFLYLYNFSKTFLLLIIMFLLAFQLYLDYLFCKKNEKEFLFLIRVRFPVTTIICINICYLISV